MFASISNFDLWDAFGVSVCPRWGQDKAENLNHGQYKDNPKGTNETAERQNGAMDYPCWAQELSSKTRRKSEVHELEKPG